MANNNPYALKFNGNSQVAIPHSASLSPTRQMTIEFDIKITSFANTWMPIIYKGNARQYSIWINSNGRMYIGTQKIGGTEETLWNASASPIMAINTWYHIAGVINRDTGSLKFYIDDVLWCSTTCTSGVDILVQSYPLYFGYTPESNSAYSPFNGYLDNIRIWNTERTLQQIKDNRKKMLNGNETNLVAYWKLDEGINTVVYDKVNGNNGVISNCTWVTGEVNLDPICKYDTVKIIPSYIWTYKNNNDSLLSGTIDTSFGTQAKYRIFINGTQYYPTSGYTLLTTTPFDIQMSIPQSAFNLGLNILYIEVVNDTGYFLYKLGEYNIYKEDRDTTTFTRDYKFESEYLSNNNIYKCDNSGLALVTNGEDIIISNDNSQIKTTGKRKINNFVITGTDDNIVTTTFTENMNYDMDIEDGKKYNYDLNFNRFTEVDGIYVSDGSSLIQDDDGNIYGFNSNAFIDIGNQNPTKTDFQNNNISDYAILFNDLSSARFIPKKISALGDGYLYKQKVNLSKYNGIKNAVYSNGIINFGTYRAWSDGTYAKSAEEYLRPTDNVHMYIGDIGDGVYRIQPITGGATIDVYCSMDTTKDEGGWMLVINTGAKTSHTNLITAISTTPITPTQTTVAKFSDSDINALRGGSSNYSNSIIRLDRPNNPTFSANPMYFRQNIPWTSNGTTTSNMFYQYYTTYTGAKTSTGINAISISYSSAISTWNAGTANYMIIMDYSSEGLISNNTYEGSRSERGGLIWIKRLP